MTVKPNKRRFLPAEGSDNFELEFEVKAMKNAIINVCKKEKSDKKCMQFNPLKRLSSEKALKHPFVSMFHNADTEPKYVNRPINVSSDENKP